MQTERKRAVNKKGAGYCQAYLGLDFVHVTCEERLHLKSGNCLLIYVPGFVPQIWPFGQSFQTFPFFAYCTLLKGKGSDANVFRWRKYPANPPPPPDPEKSELISFRSVSCSIEGFWGKLRLKQISKSKKLLWMGQKLSHMPDILWIRQRK